MKWLAYTDAQYYPDAEVVEARGAHEAAARARTRWGHASDVVIGVVPLDHVEWFGPERRRELREEVPPL